MTGRTLLEQISQPADVARLAPAQLPVLAEEVRSELLQLVSERGGHLASNLGVVELTVALLHAFDLDRDRIIWDTGHQGYAFKLLTGRRELFQSLRADRGCCGFLHREESPHDVFGAGHAGTAISAALGFAAARDQCGADNRVVAVVGDGALGSGVALEGLNSVIETTDDIIIVINDNKMSIAPNVGALSRSLSRVISHAGYNRFRSGVAGLIERLPWFGPSLRRSLHRIEVAAKRVLVPGLLFEELGLRYIGPLDGHDVGQLAHTLSAVRRLRQPLVVHVLTEKGHGYPHAEREPEEFHGLGAFDLSSGQPRRDDRASSTEATFSASFGEGLVEALDQDERVVAITAGMCHGTGMKPVRERYAGRFFDVGIAEEHAVVFAAGLAAAGMRPVVAIYASFMQRALDYVFHDVCLQKLPVVFCLDRAGAVSDGPTHHGIHDMAFWRGLPELSVLQPADGAELREMLALALARGVPVVIRYPKGSAAPLAVASRAPVVWGRAELLRAGTDVAIWAVGREAANALEIADRLTECGVDAAVVNARFAIPMDVALLQEQVQACLPLVVLENHCLSGGFSDQVRAALGPDAGVRLLCRGWPRQIVRWGTEAGIRNEHGLDTERLTADILRFVRDDNSPQVVPPVRGVKP